MNALAVVISIIGVGSSVVTFFMNALLLKHVYNSKQRMEDMRLFHYRFFLDALHGFLVAVYLTIVILYCLHPEQFSCLQKFIFYLGLPSSNVGACRSVVTLAITIERSLAAYTPIFFHNFQQRIPTSAIFMFAVFFGLFEDVVLFGICNYSFKMPKNCAALGCFVDSCFLTYWTTHKSTIFGLIFFFSTLLCFKLMILNKFGDTANKQLSRVNRLTLIDAGNVCLFDFMPSFIAHRWSDTEVFSFENIGPYGAAAKLLGCAIEAGLVFQTIVSRSGVIISEISNTQKPLRKMTTRTCATIQVAM